MIAVGDLNGDAKPDLISANQDASTVSVLLGNGTGGFAAKVDYGTCSNTHEAALGDLNGDGKLDVVLACWGGSVISVLLGNGDGTLRAKVDYAAGAAPHSVVLGRFDGDAILDAAVANHDGNTVSVLRGNGDGTFQPQVTYAVGTGPHSLRAGDLNGDGRIDLVSANEFSNSVSVLLGNGDGTFAAAVSYPAGPVPKGVAIADVSGDGKPDVLAADTAGNYPVCCNPGGNQVSILLGSGTGTLSAPTSFTVGTTPFAIATGDLDGDGRIDVATADWDGNDVTILRNTTNGGPPPDTTPPTVASTTPANGATGQPLNVAPTATFSEALDPTSVTTTNVTLVKQGTTTPIGATVTYTAATFKATLTPSAALTASTTYVARAKGGTGGIKDVAGNVLAADVTWTFTTAAAGGTTAYLSDLPYTVTANGWGPVEKDRSNGEQPAGDGLPLTLAGVVYPKGLGTHAASDIRYTMSGCTTFAAKVGLDDEVANNGSVVFQVFADGTKVYDSGVLTGASPTATVNATVTGKTALQLVVTNGGDNVDFDHADWADAKLTCGGRAAGYHAADGGQHHSGQRRDRPAAERRADGHVQRGARPDVGHDDQRDPGQAGHHDADRGDRHVHRRDLQGDPHPERGPDRQHDLCRPGQGRHRRDQGRRRQRPGRRRDLDLHDGSGGRYHPADGGQHHPGQRRDRPAAERRADGHVQRGARPDVGHDDQRDPGQAGHHDADRGDRHVHRRDLQGDPHPERGPDRQHDLCRPGQGRHRRDQGRRRQRPGRRRDLDLHDGGRRRHDRLPVGSAVHRDANGWGPVEKDQQQRRAGRRRRPAAHPGRGRLRRRAWAPTPRATSATR